MVEETSALFIEGKVEGNLVIIIKNAEIQMISSHLVPTPPSFGCPPSLKVLLALHSLSIAEASVLKSHFHFKNLSYA